MYVETTYVGTLTNSMLPAFKAIVYDTLQLGGGKISEQKYVHDRRR